MAALNKTGRPSLCSQTPPAGHQFTGVICGEDIAAGDACRLGADGKVYRSLNASQTSGDNPEGVSVTQALSRAVLGFAAQSLTAGTPITLFHDERFQYGDGVVPGTPYYVSATVRGGLDTTANGGRPVAYGLTANRIQVLTDFGG